MSARRVVIAGLGDSRLLTAIRLARHDFEVVGISAKPALVGGRWMPQPCRRSAGPQRTGLVRRQATAHLPARHPAAGSVLGVQPDGLQVFVPNGRAFRFPAWSIDRVLQPWIVRRGIYRGIRD